MTRKIIIFFSVTSIIFGSILCQRENLGISQSWPLYAVCFSLILIWNNVLYKNLWRDRPAISYVTFMRIGAALSVLFFFSIVYSGYYN